MTPEQPRSFSRVLFVRLDRIGDLVLTLPVDRALSSSQTHWWIPQGLSFVTLSADPCRNATELSRKISIPEFLRRLREVRRQRFDLAVVFHAPWWVGLLLWLARVPVRVGVKSQWHSFLFFNRGVRQKRSRAEHSELEYNFRLLEEGLRLEPQTLPRETLKLIGFGGGGQGHGHGGRGGDFRSGSGGIGTAVAASGDAHGDTNENASGAREMLLRTHGLREDGYVVVHAGMGGSALNWPTERYEQLIREVSEKEKVVLTGTAADEPYLAPLRERLGGHENVVWLEQKLKGKELITILSAARAIVAPSTGVLHLAASTGKPVVGLFSPVRVQQPRRWGPQGPQAKTLMPDVDCPGEMACLGPACPHFDCMARISVADVRREI